MRNGWEEGTFGEEGWLIRLIGPGEPHLENFAKVSFVSNMETNSFMQ